MDSCRSRTSGRPGGVAPQDPGPSRRHPSHDTIGRVFVLGPGFLCQLHAVGGDSRRAGGRRSGRHRRQDRSSNGAGRAAEAPSTWSTPGPRRTAGAQAGTDERSPTDHRHPRARGGPRVEGLHRHHRRDGLPKSIAAVIIKAEADHVLAQGQPPDAAPGVQGFFEDGVTLTDFDGIQHDSTRESTQAHDRDEVRKVWTSSELDWLPESKTGRA